MDNTDKLNLPYILPSQAQKHVTHNEALRQLDSIIHLTVQSRALVNPPSDPQAGDAYLVAAGASGIWQAHDGEIGVYVDGAWLFHEAKAGWRLWVIDENALVVFDDSDWNSVVDGATLNNVSGLGIGTDSDAVNRLAVASDATLLSHAGTGHQLKLNKATESDTASLLFQTDYSGRAEFGTTGDDDWHVKVSTDGLSWNEAVLVDKETGSVAFPSGVNSVVRTPAVDEAGGETYVLGPPNLQTVSYQRANQSLVQDRMYFSAFYVDRPTELLGGVIAQYSASNTSAAVMRAGIYELGSPSGNNWDVGALVADFGTLPADVAGHKDYTLASPEVLTPGWYLTAVGTNGAGVAVRYMRWMTPGLLHHVQFGSGGSTDLRLSSPGNYLYQSGRATEIAGGLPATWVTNPVFDFQNTIHTVFQFMIPKWTR